LKPQLAKYYSCNKSAARAVAAQVGDPVSLAIGARSLCRAEEAKLQEAVYAAYSDNPAFGTQAMETVRKKALENNTGEIVAYRANANANSSHPKEAAHPESGI
jgi:tartrate dehydratase alpha subunit/fumarate hydratase class I-like protein